MGVEWGLELFFSYKNNQQHSFININEVFYLINNYEINRFIMTRSFPDRKHDYLFIK